MEERELKRSGDCRRTPEQIKEGKWVLKGYNDTLSPKPWFDLGETDSEGGIYELSRNTRLKYRDGVSDQHFIIRPDGTMFRFV